MDGKCVPDEAMEARYGGTELGSYDTLTGRTAIEAANQGLSDRLRGLATLVRDLASVLVQSGSEADTSERAAYCSTMLSEVAGCIDEICDQCAVSRPTADKTRALARTSH